MSVERIGRFELREELGRGGMGVVFRGYDPKVDRLVAIKMIRAGGVASAEEKSELEMRFQREAVAAGQLSHPNIVTMYDLGSHGDVQYLVMELVDGVSLEKKLAGGGAQDPNFTLSILSQVGSALDYA